MDIYDLYQQAVQSPEADVDFFERTFRRLRGTTPRTLREDFAGTALLAATWARSHPQRRAWAVDVDPEPLDWGRAHNLADPAIARRVTLVEGDVLEIDLPAAEIISALNFSCCILRQRAQLKSYLESVHRALVPQGLFVMDLYGGTEAIVATTEQRHLDGFTYIWEQRSYNPISHEGRCAIHFELDDGRRLDDAFVYDWRLWTIAEVRDLLLEVGFEDCLVFWEAIDENGDGTGEYRQTTDEENQEGWLVYLVAPR